MARIRSIKPEFFTSEQVAECSTTARLLFVGLWCFCDDGGIHPYSVKRIKMEVFPGDDFTEEQVDSLLAELLSAKLLRSYVVAGQRFLIVTGWHHQRIDKPNCKYPPPTPTTQFDNHSANGIGTLSDQLPPDGSRVDGSRVESNGNGVDFSSEPEIPATEQPPADVAAFPCVGRVDQWGLRQGKLDEWQTCFPAMDVLAEVRKARQWLVDNPGRRKTAKGMTRFLFAWIERAQNGRRGPPPAPSKAGKPLTIEELADWNPIDGGGA